MNPLEPKVSIIIPVYNGSNYLADAINSALQQTYSNTEIIVVNDGSRDEGATRLIARGFGSAIRYFEKPNGGVSTALNRGIAEMTGDYFSWLSHDDLYQPSKVATQVEKLNQLEQPERTIVYSDYSILDVKSGRTREVALIDTQADAFRFRVAVQNDVHGCTLLIPRHAFSSCGVFNESLRAAQDYDLWFRMSGKFQFVHIPKSLVVGRVHDQQVGTRMSQLATAEDNEFRMRSVAALSDADIFAATRKDRAGGLLDAARLLAVRQLYPAAQYCAGISLREAQAAGPLRLAAWLRSAAYGAICWCLITGAHSMVAGARALLGRASLAASGAKGVDRVVR